MAEHRFPPPPAPVAVPVVEHAAIEPPPVVEEPLAVDPALAPPPEPVLAADPAPAVETMEEVAIFLVRSQIYPPSVPLVPTLVSGSFIFYFSVFFSANLYTLSLEVLFSCSVLLRAFVSSCFLHASVALCYAF